MNEIINKLNELKDTFHNASQYHLKESEKYKFVDTSNKFNYHLGVSFGYGYAERELDDVINEFNELIEQGWTKPRGYNLQTIDEVGFPTPFNEGI